MSIRNRGLAAEEGLVVEEALEGGECRQVVVVVAAESRLGLLLEGEGEVVVARSKMEVVEEVRAGRSMMAMEEVVARSSLAKAVEVEPRQPALALAGRWMLVTGEAQRSWTADLEVRLGADLGAVARTGEVKEERPLQAFWEAMVAADQNAGRSFLAPEEGGQDHDLQAVVERFFVLQMAEGHRTCDLILRRESLPVGLEVVVHGRATWRARRVQACQHQPAVEGRRTLVSAARIREEASTLD